jgi:hypothetical protein
MAFSDLVAATEKVFFDSCGQPVALTFADGTQLSVTGIFDAPFERVDPGGLGIESNGPQVVVSTSAVAVVPHGTTVVVDQTNYRVIAAQPDGAGLTVLILSED